MQLITDEYRSLNKALHEENVNYGTMGALYIRDLLRLLTKLKTQDVLDYGCGKSTLAHNLPFTIKQYDPAMPQHAELPTPADVVVCTDVLEHIEPELLDNVLEHLASLTKRMAYVTAAVVEAKKFLSDGRNAHLIVQPYEFWERKFEEHFKINKMIQGVNQVIAVLEPKGEGNA